MSVTLRGVRAVDKRKSYLVAAAVILSSWSFDVWLLGEAAWRALPVRVAWAGMFAAFGFAIVRVSARVSAALGAVAAIVSCVALTSLAALTGGSASPHLPMVPFLLPMIAQIEFGGRWPTWASAAVGWGGVMALLLFEGSPPLALAAWTVLFGFLAWWADFWIVRMQRLRADEVARERALAASQQQRAAALERLAASQAEREQAERLAVVGRLAFNVAHEINNPLAFVKANVELLKERMGEKDCPLCEDALLGIERIRQIVADLRSVAPERAPALEPHDPAEIVAEAVRLASVRLRSVTSMDVALDPQLPPVRCDQGRLARVLVNLLVNAADAVELHGSTRRDLIIVTGTCAGGRLLLRVEDNGPGIRPDVATTLFDPFVTTKESGAGMGLGLALSRDYVRSIGGELRVEESTLGGACFVVELPALAGEHARPAA